MSISRRSFIHNSLKAGTIFPLFSMNYSKVSNMKFSSSPEVVKNYWINFVNEINESPSYYMRTRQTEMREKVRSKLANYSGVSNKEICLTRNATESMNIIIQGIKLEKNDEILICNILSFFIGAFGFCGRHS